MPDAPAKRRWFQFRLWQMFAVLTILGLWFGWNVQRVRERTATLAYLKSGGGATVSAGASAPWKGLPIVWQWLGATPVNRIYLNSNMFDEQEQASLQALFPEAILTVNR